MNRWNTCDSPETTRGGSCRTHSSSSVMLFVLWLLMKPSALTSAGEADDGSTLHVTAALPPNSSGPWRGLTVGILYGFQVELFIFLKAGDVSLLLQVLGSVEDVFLRRFVGDHLCSVRLTVSLQEIRQSTPTPNEHQNIDTRWDAFANNQDEH